MVAPKREAPGLRRFIGEAQAAEWNRYFYLITRRGDFAARMIDDVEAVVLALRRPAHIALNAKRVDKNFIRPRCIAISVQNNTDIVIRPNLVAVAQ